MSSSQSKTKIRCLWFLVYTRPQVGFPDLAKAKGALQNVFKIVDRKSPIDPSSTEGVMLDSRAVRGELELQNVVFAYPARPTIKVFNNFCLSIPAGNQTCLQHHTLG